jgi:hypothetical protein
MVFRYDESHAPLSCRWILFRTRSNFLRAGDSTRALCIRIAEVPRVVTEKECRGCKLWELDDKRES